MSEVAGQAKLVGKLPVGRTPWSAADVLVGPLRDGTRSSARCKKPLRTKLQTRCMQRDRTTMIGGNAITP